MSDFDVGRTVGKEIVSSFHFLTPQGPYKYLHTCGTQKAHCSFFKNLIKLLFLVCAWYVPIMCLMCAHTFLINSSWNTASGLSNAVSHVFLRQNHAAVVQFEFWHPLFARMGASIPQMVIFNDFVFALWDKWNDVSIAKSVTHESERTQLEGGTDVTFSVQVTHFKVPVHRYFSILKNE